MKRSKFSLSNYKLLTFNQGELIPCGLTEVLPGDSIQQATSALVRTNPLQAPVMHPVHIRIHHWFVPHRLVWEDWEDFITGGPDGMNASVFPTVHFADDTPDVGSLADYLGVPTDVNITAGFDVSALPFRGYQLIFNEWYRDQDLVTASVIDKTSGPDTTTDLTIKNVAWEKDYFTTARPWAQKGPEVTLPLGDTAPVTGIGKFTQTYPTQPAATVYETDASASTSYTHAADLGSGNADTTWYGQQDPNNLGYPNIRADLSEATSVDINTVRRAFALQRYEEARARYGSRYTEYLRYLGIKSSDARLQRPEYLGGGKQTLQFSEVLQTAPAYVPSDDEQNGDVGSLKGHGIGAVRSNRYRRFFEEHGYIYSFISVKPKTMYVQGLPRTWNRRTKEDFFQKELQHIGQQEVKYKEIYAGHTTPEGTFGFQDRYDEYRRTESTIAGEFRTTLNYWHMARIFTGDPELNGTFVTSNPTDRIYAEATSHELQVMVNHNIQARRIVAATGSSFIY